MNIFSIYSNKIKEFLFDLEINNKLKLSDNLNNLIIELPPKDLKGDISCNAALILSKVNEKKPIEVAKILQAALLKKFSEFDKIYIAGQGFLNIEFKDEFWKKFLNKLLNLNKKYGSCNFAKKKYNIEFVSA